MCRREREIRSDRVGGEATTAIVKMSTRSNVQKRLSASAFLPREYANANRERPDAYWNYDDFTISWGCQEDYEVTKKIGRGKYSEVFLGRNQANGKECVIKILKPVRKAKIKREIKVLQNLCGGPNIVRLHDVVRDAHTKTPSLIFEWIDNVNFRTLYPCLKESDVRYYMFEILRALEFSHSRGIMHRDIKPHNIMIDPKTRRLRLIDWGLAEFYHPGKEYNVRVASRYYKGPELLVNLREYNYALDMWSLGCLFAGIIFDRDPMFKGRDNMYQLIKIAQVLGTKDLYAYLDKYDLDLDPKFDGKLGDFEARPWKDFVVPGKLSYAGKHALDLLDKLLRYDQYDRLTASEAMRHAYFAPLRVLSKNSHRNDEPPRYVQRDDTTTEAEDLKAAQLLKENGMDISHIDKGHTDCDRTSRLSSIMGKLKNVVFAHTDEDEDDGTLYETNGARREN